MATTFGNAQQAIDGVNSGVVLVARSHWGRLRLVGEGVAQFLHNQSTNDFLAMKPGQGCDTVKQAWPRSGGQGCDTVKLVKQCKMIKGEIKHVG